MKFGRGWHLTRAGLVACVVRFKDEASGWFLQGFVVCPRSGVFVVTRWFLDGINWEREELDLEIEL